LASVRIAHSSRAERDRTVDVATLRHVLDSKRSVSHNYRGGVRAAAPAQQLIVGRQPVVGLQLQSRVTRQRIDRFDVADAALRVTVAQQPSKPALLSEV
jgi:hypothetical protein